jgi:hypothetical protein
VHHIAAAATTQPWALIAAVNDSIRTAAILVGAAFAYMRFLRGRILHSNLTLSLECQLTRIGSGSAMRVAATILNSGSFRMTFPIDCRQVVAVEAIDQAVWSVATEYGEILWSEGIRREVDLSTDEGVKEIGSELEPGETYETSVLVPLPAGPWIAYRVTLAVDSVPRLIWRTTEPFVWETNEIISEQ